MNPFDSLGKFALGWIHEGHLQGWCRLAASITVSAFVSFAGIFGISVLASIEMGLPATMAVTLAVAHASISMAACVISLWLRSPLTKGIPILYPGKIEAKRVEQLVDGGETYSPNEKR